MDDNQRMYVKGITIDGTPTALGQRIECDNGRITVTTHLLGSVQHETFEFTGRIVAIHTFGKRPTT